ncbi:MAG: pentapeptide repeat-containing protein, partial [Armatimonadetes bacterium]|nr:pentapeptide repeat-containing protein [Armatimonadota bacterium]
MARTSPVRTFITAAVCLSLVVSITVTVAAQQKFEVVTGKLESQEEPQVPWLVGAVESLDEVEFGSVNLAGLRLQGANLEAAQWTDADLRGAWFVDCNFNKAEIIDTNARGM